MHTDNVSETGRGRVTPSDKSSSAPTGAPSAERIRMQLKLLYPGLLRYAAAVGHGLMPPEDLVQEAMARALSQERFLRDAESLGPYLRRTVVNICRSEMRRKAVRRSKATRVASAEANMDVYPSDASKVLSLVGPLDRALLILTVIEGHTADEAGAALGVSSAAARKRLSRARKHIRHELEESHHDGD